MNLADRIAANATEAEELLKLSRNSQLWKAIEDFIERSPVNGCGLIEKTGKLYYPRGQGPFWLKKVYAYPAGAGAESKNTVRFVFDVYMEDENRDDEYHREVSCMIDAPVALFNEFNREAFNTWVVQENDEMRQRKLASARDKMQKLLDEFPELKQ